MAASDDVLRMSRPDDDPLIRNLGRWLSAIDHAVGGFCAALLLAITLTVTAGIVWRYGFNASFPWTEELASWIFGWLIFAGAAAGHRHGRHIAVTALADLIPERWRATQLFVVDCIIAYATIMLMLSGFELSRVIGGISAALLWPNWVKYFLIPISGAVGLVYIVLVRATDRRAVHLALLAILVGAIAYALTTLIDVHPFAGISPSLIMMLAFLGTLALGVPVAFSLLFSVFVATWSVDLLPPAAVVQNMVVGSSKFILLAIPFFLTAGYLMNSGGITSRIIALADALVGHMRGGLAQVNIFHSALVGGISGSSGADTASTTKVLVPEMVKRGYSPEFSCACTASGAILPNIIPPSIAMLVYASIADASVARLFVGGVMPGILLTILMMIAVHIIASRRDYERGRQRATLMFMLRAFVDAIPSLSLAIAILATMRFGIVTATEAAVVAVLWAFVLGKFLYREFDWRQFYRDMVDSAIDSALIGFLIAVSVPFAWVLIAEQTPQQVVGWAKAITRDPAGLLLIVNLLLLFAGTFLDITASMLIMVPLFLPLMISLGVDPIHFGIIVVVNLMLGGLTPPFGILVFIAASIARVPAGPIFRECLPFLVACLIGLALITYVPDITLSLWRWLE